MSEAVTQPHATLAQLCEEIPGARVENGSAETVVRDVRHDSREVQPGDLFVARRGQKDDGARYASAAVARGAAAVIADRALPVGVPTLVVPDPELALARAASAVWGHPSFSLEVVGITGTNGKTTTAWLVEHALTKLGKRPGLLGTVEHRFGPLRWPALHTTPEADDLARRMAAMRDAGATHVVMEVSSHALALKRVAAVHFRVAALTNITLDHLDFHGTFENYARAKQSLFTEHGPGASVLNLDDDQGRAFAAGLPGSIGYSARGAAGAGVRALSPQIRADGITARVATEQGEVALASGLVGQHNLENLLCALGILIALEVPAREAAAALATAPAAPGRLERVSGPAGAPAVFVDYAHTPDALERVLAALRSACGGRLICLFGCGGDRDPSKRAPMGRAVAQGADVAVLTTDNPRTEDPAAIAAQAAVGLEERGMPRVEARALAGASRGWALELDRRRAIELAVSSARADDVVLLAGKGHEPYQEVNGVRSAFDDREEARRALASRGAAARG